MNCERFQKILMEGLSDLSPLERKAWDEHRQSCPSCLQEALDFEALEGMVRELPPETVPPPDFWERQTHAILSRIDRRPEKKAARFWDILFQPRGLLAAAAMILLMVIGFRFWQQERPLGPNEVGEPLASRLLEEAFEEGTSDDPMDELNPDQIDSYYAVLAEKYLPSPEEWDEDADLFADLNPEELDRLIDHFERKSDRRTIL